MALRTKWDVLKERERALFNEWEKANAYLRSLEVTEFVLNCTSCGTEFFSEADFARHYMVPDERYLNLGNCPTRYNNGKLMPILHNMWNRFDLWDEAHKINDSL